MSSPLHDARYVAFRELLIRCREESGLTQVQLAVALNKPQSFISKVERGERRLDIIETIDFARAMGVSPQKLLTRLTRVLPGK